MTRDEPAGSALIVALFMLALAGAGAATLAELGRRTVVRARLDRDGVRAWFLAETGLADTVTALPVGTDFTERLSGAPVAAPADWQYAAEIRDDVDESPNDPTRDVNRRVVVRVTARGTGVVRRRLEAVVGRAEPFFPGAVTVAGGVRELTGDFLLDGRDGAMGTECTMPGSGRARAGLSLADPAALPLIAHAERITGTGAAPSIGSGAIPDLTSLGHAHGGTHRGAGPVSGALGSLATPELTIVDGDAAVVDDSVTGAGLLYVTGRLRIGGGLAFTGVVAAGGGIDVTATGSLDVCGGLWAAGAAALDLQGRTTVRASAEAIRRASDLASLPARARVIAARELF